MTRRLSTILALLLLAPFSNAQSNPPGRVVDLTSADGTKLKGTFFSPAKPGPGVLLLHQCNKDRKIWDGLAQQLAASGVNVLTFDLRNFGESEGEPSDKLTPQEAQAAAQKWPADVDAAFEYLVSQPGVAHCANPGGLYSWSVVLLHPFTVHIVAAGRQRFHSRLIHREGRLVPRADAIVSGRGE